MPSFAPPADLFRALLEALRRLNAGWYVFGAQAASYWGRPRLTADIDVTVQLGPASVASLTKALSDAGFVLRVEGTPAFIEQTRVLPFLHTAQLEDALGVSDLMPVWDAELARARRGRS